MNVFFHQYKLLIASINFQNLSECDDVATNDEQQTSKTINQQGSTTDSRKEITPNELQPRRSLRPKKANHKYSTDYICRVPNGDTSIAKSRNTCDSTKEPQKQGRCINNTKR